MTRSRIGGGYSRLQLIPTVMSLGLPLIACGVLPAAPTAVSALPTATSVLSTAAPTTIPAPPTVMSVLPTAAPTSLANFDGKWQGTGITAQGVEIRFVFTVSNSNLTSIVWSHTGRDGQPCVNLAYSPIPPDLPLPRITQDGFSVELGTDLSMAGMFDSATSARGNMTIHPDDPPNCAGTFESTWVASKEE